jgi:hypothetical protein
MKNALTPLQAFQAMTDFFDICYQCSHSDQIGALLGAMDMNIFGHGEGTADPAIWEDWIECVNADNELTTLKAFQAVQKFVAMRYSCEPDNDVVALISGMQIYNDRSVANPAFWEDWIRCVNKILETQKHNTD